MSELKYRRYGSLSRQIREVIIPKKNLSEFSKKCKILGVIELDTETLQCLIKISWDDDSSSAVEKTEEVQAQSPLPHYKSDLNPSE